jgi:hypothetical protein
MHRRSARSPIHFSFVLLFLFASGGPALADSVTGRVVDADGRPVSGARVLASGDDVRLPSVTTDEDGRFSVEAPVDARIVLRVAAAGFRAEVRAVAASAQPRDVGTIALTVGALSESVVVSASQV